jgi:hypothetical protein
LNAVACHRFEPCIDRFFFPHKFITKSNAPSFNSDVLLPLKGPSQRRAGQKCCLDGVGFGYISKKLLLMSSFFGIFYSIPRYLLIMHTT